MQTERPVRGTRYEDDCGLLAEEQAAALTGRRWADLDVGNLAEEIGDLSRSLDHALVSHIKVLLAHLLKREFQRSPSGPPRRSSPPCAPSSKKRASGSIDVRNSMNGRRITGL